MREECSKKDLATVHSVPNTRIVLGIRVIDPREFDMIREAISSL